MKKKHAFLSYVREDLAQVARLRAELLAAGESVWWDQDIGAGTGWELGIRQALADAHSFLLCLSPASDSRVRSGTFPELLDAIGLQRELRPGAIFIIPVRLESSSVPRFPIDATRMLDSLQQVDLFPDAAWSAGFSRLVQSVRASPFHPASRPSSDESADVGARIQPRGDVARVSRPTLPRLALDRALPRLHAWLTRLRVLPEPPDWADLSRYLRRTRARLENELVRKTYIPASGLEVERDPAFDVSIDPFVRPVHQVIREVMGRSRGGDAANAQIAAVNRKSRIVRDLQQTLMRAKAPIVLLGDPGAGKTMTLQSLVIELVRREERRVFPLIPIYVRLGEFHAAGPVNADTVFDYLERCCPPELLPYLHDLDRDGERLLVVFDGMDEMSRERYTEHTEALSLFAGERAGVTQMLFSCRITDFSPSFTHQRLVILPFEETQVAAFLRQHIARFPAEIDGTSYTLKGLAAKIARGDLPFDAKNPFVLWLLCFQLSTTRRWPESRIEMLDFYVSATYERKVRTLLGGEQRLPAFEVAVAAWENLAYRIASENKGTAMRVAELERDWRNPGCGLPEALHAGRLCGVLEESRDRQEHLVRFAHHRFQEYFAARFVGRCGPAIDWLPALDAPRWQETMINVVLLGGGVEGVNALTRSIEQKTAQLDAHWQAVDRRNAEAQKAASEQKSSNPTEARPQDPALLSEPEVEALETVLADRVEFAFRLLRQARGAARATCTGLSGPLKSALQMLSDRGNPVTQVKMLTACRNVPDVDYLEALRAPLNSSIGWVRSQAIAMLGAIGAKGAALGSDLPTEIGYELGRASLLQQAPTYLKAARDSQSPRDIGCLAFGAVLHVALLALLAAGAMLPLLPPAGAWVSDRFGYGLLSVAAFENAYLAAVAVGVVAAMLFKPALSWCIVLGTPVVFTVLLWCAASLWHGRIIEGVTAPLAVLLVSPVLILAGFAIALPALLVTVGSYLLVTRRMRTSRHPPRAFAADAWRHCGFADGWEWIKVAGPFLLLGIIPVGALTLIVDLLGAFVFRGPLEWLAGWFSFNALVTAGLLIVCFYLIARQVARKIDRNDWAGSALTVALGVLGYGALVAVVLAYATGLLDAALDRLSLYAGRGGAVALLLGFVALSGYCAWQLIRRYLILALMRNPYPPHSFAVDEWTKRLAGSQAAEQRHLLMRTTHQSVGLTPREYLDVLKAQREVIKQGLAEDLYWQQRHDLEQVLRQELASR